MQLKFDKQIKNKVITIDLETMSFSPMELKVLDDLGEPIISFDKIYGIHPVKFDRKIKSGFKLKINFDGKIDLSGAVSAANEFFEEIQVLLATEMAALVEKAALTDFTEEKGIADIIY